MNITKELLEYHYIISRKSSENIGKEFGCSGRNIRYLLKKFGFQEEMKARRQTVSFNKAPTNKGIIRTNTPKLGRYYVYNKGSVVPRARFLLEEHLGRKLKRTEIVHHKDDNPLNDCIDNLEILTRSEHIKHHNPISYRWKSGKSCTTP